MSFSFGINEFYYKIKKHIALYKAYSGIKNLDFIIKACRLKPLYILIAKRIPRTRLFDLWIDEFGNSFWIGSFKRHKKETKHWEYYVRKSDSKITEDIWGSHLSTDLYLGLDIKSIAKISKSCYLFIGKTEKDYKDHFIVSFLGIDGYLRTFSYLNKEWKLIPTLHLGGSAVKRLGELKNLKEGNFKKLTQNYRIVMPCVKQQSWLSSLPLVPEIVQVIKENNLEPLEFLIKENICQE